MSLPSAQEVPPSSPSHTYPIHQDNGVQAPAIPPPSVNVYYIFGNTVYINSSNSTRNQTSLNRSFNNSQSTTTHHVPATDSGLDSEDSLESPISVSVLPTQDRSSSTSTTIPASAVPISSNPAFIKIRAAMSKFLGWISSFVIYVVRQSRRE